ncbi:MAG: hypothetical protein AABX07_01645 [Nanoarchaeota archaeon]
MILSEIVLGKTSDSKREAVQENLGQQVIINDTHNSWCHGVILKEGYDNEVYQAQLKDERGKMQFHYHDLNTLLRIY